MPLTIQEEDLIRDELKRTRNYYRLARQYGVQPDDIRNLLNPDTTFKKLTEDGLGRIELREYIVAVKQATDKWPDLSETKAIYDEGKIEMCIGRDGENLIQYAIPRKWPTKPRNYFYREEAE